ncbi:MAG: hypothetical protein CXX80_00720 [Methanobacteriota archaeon]|nr:MAG: hypothetical protein CXX81_28565 [Euryarchaeota archaeon]PXY76661.1 MAG: hypothetical protein CXX81_14055 [Euryarchaeota archaeon]PXY77384.1 MAG: hypothetical protein CXX80_00720 [Euryarchaeota archaeon]
MLMRSFDSIPVVLTGYRKVILMKKTIFRMFSNGNILILFEFQQLFEKKLIIGFKWAEPLDELCKVVRTRH